MFSLYSVLQLVIMHWKVALLVAIAVISGLISAYHMYLLSSRGSHSISVALEIPLQQQADHSTKLELNIQSISHERTTDKHPVRHKDPVEYSTTWETSKSVDTQQHSVVTEGNTIHGLEHTVTPFAHKAAHYLPQASNTQVEEVRGEGEMREEVWGKSVMSEVVWGEDGVTLRGSNGEVGEEELGEDNEDYVVLLDTGDYELEEKDMDRSVDATLTPPTSHPAKARANGKRRHIKPRPHGTQSTTAMVMGTIKEREDRISASKHLPKGEANDTVIHQLQQAGSRGVADTAASNLLSQTRPQVVPNEENQKITVMSKEEYYVRQATSTHPPPPTHLHRTTAPKTIGFLGHNHTSSQCSQLPCLQYLSVAEKNIFNKCQRRTVPRRTQSPPKCQCRFREGVGKKRVALVSLPGSGNTWLRGLVEKATGICTGYPPIPLIMCITVIPDAGSIYCDRTLREGGLCGEGLRGTSVVAVKTHDTSLQWRGGKQGDSSRPMFDKAIFLIRNPFRANIAEWNRQMSKKHASDQVGSSHIKYVTSKAFFGK